MRLPENLAPENYPIAWLIDSWQGGGILEYEGVEPAAYLHEISFDSSDGGPYVKVTSTIWLAKEDPSVVDKEAPGQVTYDALTKDLIWASHVGYLRVNPETAKRPDGSSQIEAMIATPAGVGESWVGLINGPRLQLVTDAIVRSTSGADITQAQIVAGSVASDLFYAVDMEAFGSQMRNYLAGRLSRQFDDAMDASATEGVPAGEVSDADDVPAAGEAPTPQSGE